MTTYSTESWSVAGGTGLQLPTGRVEIRQRDWTSTAPPFLRRTAADFAAAEEREAAKPEPVRAPKPPRTRNRSTGSNRAGRTPKPLSPEDVADICRRYPADALDVLATEYHVDWKRIKAELIANGVPIREPGGGHAKGELTPEQIAAAKADYATGLGLRALGPKYGMRRERLAAILRAEGVHLRSRMGDRERRAA